jgi:hypothetical protein
MIKQFLSIVSLLLFSVNFGCDIVGTGGANQLNTMYSQFIPDVRARGIWLKQIYCERYNRGIVGGQNPCVVFEQELAMFQKACAETRSGVAKYPNPSACEVLDIYEVKYKNMPAPEPGRTVRAPAN